MYKCKYINKYQCCKLFLGSGSIHDFDMDPNPILQIFVQGIQIYIWRDLDSVNKNIESATLVKIQATFLEFLDRKYVNIIQRSRYLFIRFMYWRGVKKVQIVALQTNKHSPPLWNKSKEKEFFLPIFLPPTHKKWGNNNFFKPSLLWNWYPFITRFIFIHSFRGHFTGYILSCNKIFQDLFFS